MIKYRLICKNCESLFDSWFSSSKEYEKLKKLKYLNCHSCNSLNVEKTLMAPNVLNSKDKIVSIPKNKKFIKIKNKIKEYQKFIKKNFNLNQSLLLLVTIAWSNLVTTLNKQSV